MAAGKVAAAAAAATAAAAAAKQSAAGVNRASHGAGPAMLVGAVLLVGWLYASGRLPDVWRAMQGEGAMPPSAPPVAGSGGGALLPPAAPGVVVPGGGAVPSLPPVPPARLPGSRWVRIDSKRPGGRPVQIEVSGGPDCWATVITAATAQGWSTAAAARLAGEVCRGV